MKPRGVPAARASAMETYCSTARHETNGALLISSHHLRLDAAVVDTLQSLGEMSPAESCLSRRMLVTWTGQADTPTFRAVRALGHPLSLGRVHTVVEHHCLTHTHTRNIQKDASQKLQKSVDEKLGAERSLVAAPRRLGGCLEESTKARTRGIYAKGICSHLVPRRRAAMKLLSTAERGAEIRIVRACDPCCGNLNIHSRTCS